MTSSAGTMRSGICSIRTTSFWSAHRTAPATGRNASTTISSGSGLPGRSFRSIRTAAISGARLAIRSSTRCRKRLTISRSSRPPRPRSKSWRTAAPPARAAPPSMPRASAKAATPKAANAARSCATAIARTGITVIGPTCMGVACGAANFSTCPTSRCSGRCEPGRDRRAERRDGDGHQPRRSTISG